MTRCRHVFVTSGWLCGGPCGPAEHPECRRPCCLGLVRLERRGNDWIAYLEGKSSPILRPVPGNTHPASAARWPTREAALAELPEMLGVRRVEDATPRG